MLTARSPPDWRCESRVVRKLGSAKGFSHYINDFLIPVMKRHVELRGGSAAG